jgi:hypothetical protein
LTIKTVATLALRLPGAAEAQRWAPYGRKKKPPHPVSGARTEASVQCPRWGMVVVPSGALRPLGAGHWPSRRWGGRRSQHERARQARAHRLPGQGRARTHPLSGAVRGHGPGASRWGPRGAAGGQWPQAGTRGRRRDGVAPMGWGVRAPSHGHAHSAGASHEPGRRRVGVPAVSGAARSVVRRPRRGGPRAGGATRPPRQDAGERSWGSGAGGVRPACGLARRGRWRSRRWGPGLPPPKKAGRSCQEGGWWGGVVRRGGVGRGWWGGVSRSDSMPVLRPTSGYKRRPEASAALPLLAAPEPQRYAITTPP